MAYVLKPLRQRVKMVRPRIAYMGIDPGCNGGMAVVYARSVAQAIRMPLGNRDILDWLEETVRISQVRFAFIEKVGGFMRADDRSKNIGSGHTMFTFGCSYGKLLMALTATRIPFDEVLPRAWQQAIGVVKVKGRETKTAYKNRLKARAQQLFPAEKVTLATADALLIAEYCRRKQEGIV